MSRTPAIEMRRLEAIEHPPCETVVEKAKQFLARTSMTVPQLADRIGVGYHTLKLYLRGEYASHPGSRRGRCDLADLRAAFLGEKFRRRADRCALPRRWAS
jgi:hypothetical protein